MRLGVIGLGKLGLPYAALLASVGHTVHAWDKLDTARLAIENPDTYDGVEPKVDELLRETYRAGTLLVSPPDEIAQTCDVVFIIVPTPSTDAGSFSSTLVNQAVMSLVNHSEPGHKLTICIVSTVSPGTCRALSHVASSAADLVYSPSFIALGDIVNDLRHPDVILVGSDNADAAQDVLDALLRVVDHTHQSNVRMTDLVTAEISKIALNAYITTKIAFANTLGRVCEYWGANIDDATTILGSDSRIGSKYLTAGSGFGGPCFPRDNRAFAHAAKDVHTLSLHVDQLNDEHASYVAWRAVNESNGASTFHVLGTAYKEGTPYTFDSFGIKVMERLESLGLRDVATSEADVVVIALPLKTHQLSGKFKPGTCVIDMWRTHGYLNDEDVKYVPFGVQT